MNRARDFARRNVRAAFWLKRAGLAVLLASEVDHRAFLRQAVAWLGESAVDIFPQLFAAGYARLASALAGECVPRTARADVIATAHHELTKLGFAMVGKMTSNL